MPTMDELVPFLIVLRAMICCNRKAGGGCRRCYLPALALLFTVGLLVWLGKGSNPSGEVDSPTRATPGTIRIGLIPERDIFQQRARYRALVDHLATTLGRPIELVTVNSYENIMRDFADKQVDVAFLGSLVAVLTVDRFNARILVKPELIGGASSYRGVIFIREDSPIQSIEQLRGKSIAMVRTTMGGNLYPMYELAQRHMLDPQQTPKVTWVGTHDEAFNEVAEGRADAGAIKDLRLDELEKSQPTRRFRRLCTSEPVPDSALVVRGDVPRELSDSIADALLKMDATAQGRQALATFGAVRFVPCRISEYQSVDDMVDGLRDLWPQTGIGGNPPRPLTPTATDASR